MTLIATLGRQVGLSSPKAPTFGQLAELRRQRKALARLDDAALRDLGLTRREAITEARRKIWDVPSNWLR